MWLGPPVIERQTASRHTRRISLSSAEACDPEAGIRQTNANNGPRASMRNELSEI